MATDLTVANTILAQLGGRRFTLMTGARHFAGSDAALSFSLPRAFAKGGINKIRIALTWRDDYTIEAWRCAGGRATLVETVEGVYADTLRAVFTRITGLAVSL
jgi:hypothetical protein